MRVWGLRLRASGIGGLKGIYKGLKGFDKRIKEYTLNINRVPNMISGIFLNQGILESPG